MTGLTDRQREVLRYVHAFIGERGWPPTLREVMARFGLRSTNATSDHLRALERKGCVVLDSGRARSGTQLHLETS